jgi:hypothetical protein
MMLDTSSKGFRDEFKKLTNDDLIGTTKIFASSGIDHMIVRTNESPVDPMIRFFKKRGRRK